MVYYGPFLNLFISFSLSLNEKENQGSLRISEFRDLMPSRARIFHFHFTSSILCFDSQACPLQWFPDDYCKHRSLQQRPQHRLEGRKRTCPSLKPLFKSLWEWRKVFQKLSRSHSLMSPWAELVSNMPLPKPDPTRKGESSNSIQPWLTPWWCRMTSHPCSTWCLEKQEWCTCVGNPQCLSHWAGTEERKGKIYPAIYVLIWSTTFTDACPFLQSSCVPQFLLLFTAEILLGGIS